MSDTINFPLFDPNADAHNSGRFSAERFSSSCLDEDARRRLAEMYRENEQIDGTAEQAAPARPEGLDSLLARASEESAALPNGEANRPAGEPPDSSAPEDSEAERLVKEALAAVQSGTQQDRSVEPSQANAACEAEAEATQEAEQQEKQDVEEFVHEIQREVVVADLSAAAEDFVAAQTGHAAPMHENVEPHATCDSVVEAAQNAAAEISAPANESVIEIPAASLASDVPWEPLSEAAKRYDVADASEPAKTIETLYTPPALKEAAEVAREVVESKTQTQAAAASPSAASKQNSGSRFTSRLRNFWGDSAQPSLTLAIGIAAVPAAKNAAPANTTSHAAEKSAVVRQPANAETPRATETSAAEKSAVPAVQPATHAVKTDKPQAAEAKAPAVPTTPERRRKRRALISAPLRVRTKNLTGHGLDEVAATVDVSRIGVLFHTTLDCYSRGLELAVTFPYSKMPHGIQAEQQGTVARVQKMDDGRFAVAIMLGVVPGQHIVDTYGRKLANTSVEIAGMKSGFISTGMLGEKLANLDVKKPLVLAVDADSTTRDMLKSCLEKERYEVIVVSTAKEGRELLNMLTPALIIAEVEGEGLPGYDLCAHVKQTPRLRHIPVVLTTNSAYPSDYSNAHSLGAVVCMAKPYKLERITHIARLLAPPPSSAKNSFTPRPADPTRLPGRDCGVTVRSANGTRKTAPSKTANGNGKGIFKFPTFR